MMALTTSTVLNWPQYLQQYPALHVLPEALRHSAQLLRFDARCVLFSQGKPPTGLLFLLRGVVELTRYSEQGAPIVLQRVQHGFVAEASLFAPVYHCDVQSIAAGELLVFSRAQFLAALADSPDFARDWITQLSLQLRQSRTQIARLGLPYAADRVRHYLASEGDAGEVTLIVSRKAWAQELGLTHEALYRCLKQMAQAGVVTIEGRTIRLTG